MTRSSQKTDKSWILRGIPPRNKLIKQQSLRTSTSSSNSKASSINKILSNNNCSCSFSNSSSNRISYSQLMVVRQCLPKIKLSRLRINRINRQRRARRTYSPSFKCKGIKSYHHWREEHSLNWVKHSKTQPKVRVYNSKMVSLYSKFKAKLEQISLPKKVSLPSNRSSNRTRQPDWMLKPTSK